MSRDYCSWHRLAKALAITLVGSAAGVTSASAQDVLFYGPSAGNEATLASNLGYNVTVASAAQWSAMTTADFAQYDALAFGDANCTGNASYLSTAEANKAVWSAAASGKRAFITTDIGLHFGTNASSVGGQFLDRILGFVSSSAGTGLYFSSGCAYFAASLNTPVPVLSEFGDFRITGQGVAGTCNQVAIDDPTHPTITGLTESQLAYGCSVHGIFTTSPAGLETVARGVGSSLTDAWLLASGDNSIPVANAGTDQTVNEGDTVNLDGQASSDPDGDPLTFQWSQTAGPLVTLDDDTSPTPSFVAPFVTTNQTITFELLVSDGFAFSDPDFVNIGVLQSNNPPIADAGDDSTVKEGVATMLDGTNSFDPDGEDVTSYQWTQIGGPAVTLDDATSATPSFVAPVSTAGLSVVFELVVSDGKEPSAPDTVTIDIVENSPPVADAGPDQTKDEGSIVDLDGTGSSDPDMGDTLSFQWAQVSGPAVTLSDETTATPSFDAPPVSTLTAFAFELTVTDDDPFNPKSSTDEVIINVRNANDPPSCELAFADPASMWPPNHKMEAVSIEGVMDEDSIYNMITLTVTGITQDEPVNGTGDGDSSPDASVVWGDPADSVMLRRERAGDGNGRVYKVSFNAFDGFEGCDGSVFVAVNHDRRGADAIDDGQTVDSTQP